MTEVRVLWRKIEIAAVVDGCTRKIVALKAFGRRSTSRDLVALISDSIDSGEAAPRYLVTDHGSQFRARFRGAVERIGVTHVRCQVYTWYLNAKVERSFRDLKPWLKGTPMRPSTCAVQRRLDAYREWFNRFRPHSAYCTLTPDEAEAGLSIEKPVAYRQTGEGTPRFRVHRKRVRGDPCLAYPVIQVRQAARTRRTDSWPT